MKLKLLDFLNKYDLSKASPEFTQGILKDYNRHRPTGAKDKVCYAPFKSIYFGHYGMAVACCYNRTYILGNYPKQTIQEIWNGEQATKLRKYISENNMDHGCQGCKSQILAGGSDGNKAKSKQYDEQRLNDSGYPSVMEFELSNVCNLECEMCSGDFSSLIRKNREGREPIKENYDAEFVKQLEEFIPHLQEVKFYGGEPFLIEIYYQIWEKIIELNPSVRISVQTNGTILNNRVKRIMEQSEFHMNISIDSLEKENYERIRLNAKFERTMENIAWFRQYCKERKTFFGLSACAMQQTWHELPSFVRYCNELEVPVYFHTVFFPKKSAFHTLSGEELQKMVEVLSAEKLPSSNQVEIENKQHFEDTISQLQHLIREKKFKTTDIFQLEDVEDLRLFIDRFIEEYSGWSEVVKVRKRRKIMNKLDSVVAQLGDDYPFKKKFEEFDFQNTVSVLTVLNQLETLPATALVLLGKATK